MNQLRAAGFALQAILFSLLPCSPASAQTPSGGEPVSTAPGEAGKTPAVIALPAAAATAAATFALVNGKPITQGEFHSAYANHLRQKFYHGQISAEQLAQERKLVAEQLVDQILFLEEIDRRGVGADEEDVNRRVAAYDQRYANNPNWQKSREAMLPGLREQLARQSRLRRLEESVRAVPLPSPEEVQKFYESKPELFTEPEKLRLHAIILAVEPSSPRATWDAAKLEATMIVRRLREGDNFAEQARLVSADASAANGGDMGYLHVGMMPESLQAKIDQFKLGEIAEPLEMLQGIGVFRLDERIPAKLQPLERVAERARELLHRERKEKAWEDFLAKLRADAKIVLMEAPAAPPSPASPPAQTSPATSPPTVRNPASAATPPPVPPAAK